MTTEEQRNSPAPEDGGEDFAALLAAHDEASSGQVQPGQKVKGTIIAVTGENVFVDVGLKEDGIMDRKDLLDADGKEIAGPGETVEAWVVAASPQGIVLSRSMSGSGVAALEEARDAGVPVEGRVTGTCKGGYLVEVLGKSAFCPGSQMDAAASDGEGPVGRTLQFLVTRVENRGRNIVVSRRALLDRERRESLEKLLETLKPGDMVEGRVTRLAPFGAFVELAPAVEGMIHLSELAWSRVASAEEAVSVGDPVRVKVLGITTNEKGQTRISLSRKQAEGDPWQDVPARLAAGSVVQGKVRRLAPFGAFVEVLPGVEGLIHISELSWAKRVNKPEDVLAVGDEVSVKVKDVNPETRRIALSLRDAEGDPWQDAEQRFPVGATVEGTVEGRSQYGLFVTLAPGITGLLPAGVIKNSKKPELAKLDKGDSVTLVVQNIDSGARRISLTYEGADNDPQAAGAGPRGAGGGGWKQHAVSGAPVTGIMAQALQKAMQKSSKERS
ncbi:MULTISPECIES: 30S ribosomal protein S1 [unclassified Desulfovibrio]|uniref:30S ribosomal protein S1 n=1 Tax=unclassified Desulfovibrio TaxID=2593640 RepID=UPI0013ECB2AE|nr:MULTISPECIES: 30S ribosomal protein S1 [unclassified Desulfovibrio]